MSRARTCWDIAWMTKVAAGGGGAHPLWGCGGQCVQCGVSDQGQLPHTYSVSSSIVCFTPLPPLPYHAPLPPPPLCHCLQGTIPIETLRNGMLVLQCEPPPALVLPYLPVWQRMSWIFILVALAAAAILMAAIWWEWEGGAVKGGEEGGLGVADEFPGVQSTYPVLLCAGSPAGPPLHPFPTHPPFSRQLGPPCTHSPSTHPPFRLMLSCSSVCC